MRALGRKVLQFYRKLINPGDYYRTSFYDIRRLLEAKEYDKAREVLLRFVERRDAIQVPSVVEYILLSLGATWLVTEKYEEMISFFSKYLSRHPKDSAAYAGRAAALWYSGRFQQAIDDYSHALELKPTDILSLSSRGQILAEVGQAERAMQDLNAAIEELKAAPMPNESWRAWYGQIEAFVHRGRGVSLEATGEHSAALQEFNLSISLSPENAWAYFDRACAFDAAGNLENARLDYQTALTKSNPPLNPIRKKRAQTRLNGM